MIDHSVKEIKPARLQSIELLRIVAAFGIIAYHSQAPLHDLMYSGLIIFLILSPMLDTHFNWHRTRPILSIAKSLMLPWAFWMVIYGIINKLQHKPFLPGGWQNILYGTSPHLWFLPFMFIVLTAINFVKSRSINIFLWSCTLLAAIFLATVSLWRSMSLTWLAPFPHWIHATPPVLVGVVLGLMGKMGNIRIVALIIIALGLVVADTTFLPGVAIPYTVGILLTAITALYSARLLPQNWSVQPVSSCMMGVYLCHMIVLKIVGKVTGSANYITVILTFVIALCGVYFVRRFFKPSKLVLG
jgi:hypothetical protein